MLAALIRLAYYNVTEDQLEFPENAARLLRRPLVTTVALIIPLIHTYRVP